MLLLIFGTIVVILIYYFIVKYYNYWEDHGVKQGKVKLLFGDTWGMILQRHTFADLIQHVYYKCPGTRYCGMYQFFIRILVIKDPELIKQITVKNFDHFHEHVSSLFGADMDPLWSRNLLALGGEKWHEMRSILSPSFTSSKMRTMFSLMVECAENFVQHFLNKEEDILTYEMKDIFTRFSSNVIATTAFGVKIDSLADPNNQFYLMGKEVASIGGFRKTLQLLGHFLFPNLFKKFFKVRLFSAEVAKFFTEVINNTIKTRVEKGIVRPDMIHLLMEAQKGIQKEEESIIDTGFAVTEESATVRKSIITKLTNEDITAQALIFFFAGFESVSSLLTFLAYELAVNQDVQDRLREEIQTTLAEYGGQLTYEGLLKMKYMDMVVSEALRKWPSATVLDRICSKPYVIDPSTPDEKPLYIQQGTIIWIPVFAIHRDPDNFPEPERFDPERFNDENKGNIKPYTYMPFGAGPRNCIGSRFALLEAKVLFFHLLLDFKIVPVERTVIPVKIGKNNFFLNSEGGLWLGLSRLKREQTVAT